jgi:hypothetical protein
MMSALVALDVGTTFPRSQVTLGNALVSEALLPREQKQPSRDKACFLYVLA